MEPGNPDFAVLALWIGAKLTGLIILALLFVWAIANGQFTGMKRGTTTALRRPPTNRNAP